MTKKVRIWALESVNDGRAVNILAQKIVKYANKSNDIGLYPDPIDTTTLAAVINKNPLNGLENAVSNYINNGDIVVFVIDDDGPASLATRKRQPHSYINQARNMVQKFDGKVYLAIIEHEIEAWLLIDCCGIAGYFSKDKEKLSPHNCHEILFSKEKYKNLIKKRQKGDTANIVEAYQGGKNAKEELIHFSKEVIKLVNPNIKDKDVGERCYKEKRSPEVAQFIKISKDTLVRNNSLKTFSELILKDTTR